jgi:hypothetical protein
MGAIKKTLLAAVAASSIASTAHAVLLIGEWCLIDDVDGRGQSTWHYRRKTNDDDCEGKLTIERDGSKTRSVECEFSRVRRLPKNRGYAMHSDCDRIVGNADVYEREEELRIIGGVLHYRTLRSKCVAGPRC